MRGKVIQKSTKFNDIFKNIPQVLANDNEKNLDKRQYNVLKDWIIDIRKLLKNKKNTQQALQDLLSIYDIKRDRYWLSLYGECLFNLKRYSQVIKVIHCMPDPNIHEIYRLARAYEAIGKMHEAIDVYQLVKHWKNDELTLSFIAICYEKLGLYEQQMATLSLIPGWRDSPRFLSFFAQAKVKTGFYQEGIQLHQEALERWPGNFFCISGYAYSLTYTGHYQEALKFFLKMHELKSEDMTTWHSLAICYLKMGEVQQALDLLTKAIAKFPSENGLIVTLAMCYEDLGKMDEAINLIKTRAGWKKDHALLQTLAIVYKKKGNIIVADRFFTLIEAQFGVDEALLAAWARIFHDYQHYDKALAIWEKLPHWQMSKAALLNRSLSLYYMGDYPSALASIKSIDNYEEDIDCQMALADCLRHKEDFSAALIIYEAAEKKWTLGDILLKKAACFEEMCNFKKALACYKKYMEEFGVTQEVERRLGACYQKQGNDDKAVTQYSALEKFGLSKSSMIDTARFLQKRKSFIQALNILEHNQMKHDKYVTIFRAYCYFDNKELDKAINELEQLYQIYQDPDIICIKAFMLQKIEKYDLAAEAYQSFSTWRYHKKALIGLIGCYYRAQQYTQAKELIHASQLQFPFAREFVYYQLKIALKTKEAQVGKDLQGLIEQYPHWSSLHLLKAKYEAAFEDLSSAGQAYHQLIKQFPYCTKAYLKLYDQYVGLGKMEEARRVRQTAEVIFEDYQLMFRKMDQIVNRHITPLDKIRHDTDYLKQVSILCQRLKAFDFYLYGEALFAVLMSNQLQVNQFKFIDFICADMQKKDILALGFRPNPHDQSLYYLQLGDFTVRIHCRLVTAAFTIDYLTLDNSGEVLNCNKEHIDDFELRHLRPLLEAKTTVQDPKQLLRALEFMVWGFKPTAELEQAIRQWSAPTGFDWMKFNQLLNLGYAHSQNKKAYLRILKDYGILAQLNTQPEQGLHAFIAGLAQAYHSQHNIEDILTQLTKTADKDELILIAQCFLDQEYFLAALTILAKCHGPLDDEAMLLTAETYEGMGNFKQALATYQQYIDQFGKTKTVLKKQAHCFYRQGQVPAALLAYEEIEKEYGPDNETSLGKIQVHIKQKSYDKAQQEIDNAPERNEEITLAQAHLYLCQKQYQEGEWLYFSCADWENNKSVYLGIAYSQYKQRNYASAFNILQNAKRKFPYFPEVDYKLAKIARETGNLTQLDKLIGLHPRWSALQVFRAHLLAQAECSVSAGQGYQEIINKFPYSSAAHLGLYHQYTTYGKINYSGSLRQSCAVKFSGYQKHFKAMDDIVDSSLSNLRALKPNMDYREQISELCHRLKRFNYYLCNDALLALLYKHLETKHFKSIDFICTELTTKQIRQLGFYPDRQNHHLYHFQLGHWTINLYTEAKEATFTIDCLAYENSVEEKTRKLVSCDSQALPHAQQKCLATLLPSKEALEKDPQQLLRAIELLVLEFFPTSDLEQAIRQWSPAKGFNWSVFNRQLTEALHHSLDMSQYLSLLREYGILKKIKKTCDLPFVVNELLSAYQVTPAQLNGLIIFAEATNSVDYRLAIARIFYELEYFSFALALYGEDQDADILLAKANCYQEMGAYDKASACYHDALKKHKNQNEVLIKIAGFLTQYHLFDEALEIYDELRKRVGDKKDVILALLHFFHKKNEIAHALSLIENCAHLSKDKDILLAKARLLIEQKKDQQALSIYYGIEDWQNDKQVLIELADHQYRLKNYQHAYALLQQARDKFPHSSAIDYRMAKIVLKTQDEAKLPLLKQITANYPRWSALHLLIAKSQSRREPKANAGAAYKAVFLKFPDCPGAYLGLYEQYMRLNSNQEARGLVNLCVNQFWGFSWFFEQIREVTKKYSAAFTRLSLAPDLTGQVAIVDSHLSKVSPRLVLHNDTLIASQLGLMQVKSIHLINNSLSEQKLKNLGFQRNPQKKGNYYVHLGPYTIYVDPQVHSILTIDNIDSSPMALSDFQQRILRPIDDATKSLLCPQILPRIIELIVWGFKPTVQLEQALATWRPPLSFAWQQFNEELAFRSALSIDREQYERVLNKYGIDKKISLLKPMKLVSSFFKPIQIHNPRLHESQVVEGTPKRRLDALHLF